MARTAVSDVLERSISFLFSQDRSALHLAERTNQCAGIVLSSSKISTSANDSKNGSEIKLLISLPMFPGAPKTFPRPPSTWFCSFSTTLALATRIPLPASPSSEGPMLEIRILGERIPSPQCKARPSLVIATEYRVNAETFTTKWSSNAETRTGWVLLSLSPSPSCPTSLRPPAKTTPVSLRNSVKLFPDATCTIPIPLSGCTWRGIGK
mmetsp:Transcript_5534/g.23492  ORF Transcript_5534/g.23492 Transcript_5534/m.23492 type:complete len:209 (-) Transcript_5534:927-1553(-)